MKGEQNEWKKEFHNKEKKEVLITHSNVNFSRCKIAGERRVRINDCGRFDRKRCEEYWAESPNFQTIAKNTMVSHWSTTHNQPTYSPNTSQSTNTMTSFINLLGNPKNDQTHFVLLFFIISRQLDIITHHQNITILHILITINITITQPVNTPLGLIQPHFVQLTFYQHISTSQCNPL